MNLVLSPFETWSLFLSIGFLVVALVSLMK